MKFRERRRVQAEPGMTGMIDIIFLLLLFFVLSSTFILQPGIKIKLPRALTTEQPARKDLILIIARDRRVFLNNEQLPFNALWGRLIEELKFQPEAVLVLRADRDVPHGFVVRVMDVAKQAGADRIAIATAPARRDQKKK
ncbi:MAG: biopolymer transporter ExbD [Nitrospinota bacterium]|jgi:biopolymer transport protein ExbD|nr:biopolymer transporter ExbD [Planctomycetota bacterium]MDP7664204.1 biopolymer transporter ExbD [Nitrospinota bacterium]